MIANQNGNRFFINGLFIILTSTAVGCGDPENGDGQIWSNERETIIDKVLTLGTHTQIQSAAPLSIAIQSSSKLPIPSQIHQISSKQLCSGKASVFLVETKSKKVVENLSPLGLRFQGSGCATKIQATRELVGKYSVQIHFENIPDGEEILLDTVEYTMPLSVVSRAPEFSPATIEPVILNSGNPIVLRQETDGALYANNNRDLGLNERVEFPKATNSSTLITECRFNPDFNKGINPANTVVLEKVEDKCPLMVVQDSRGKFFARFKMLAVGYDDSKVGATSTFATYTVPQPKKKKSFFDAFNPFKAFKDPLGSLLTVSLLGLNPDPVSSLVTLAVFDRDHPGSISISRVKAMKGEFEFRVRATNAVSTKTLVIARLPAVIENNEPYVAATTTTTAAKK